MSKNLKPLPKDPSREFNPLKYRRDQVVENLKEHMDAVEDFLNKADEAIQAGRIGEAKDALKKMHSAAGSCLASSIYAQAMEWADGHPSVRIDKNVWFEAEADDKNTLP